MPRCSTSILLHSAGGALERPTARTRCTYSTYHTTLHYIPQDENTAAGRPRAGGWRPGTRRPAIGGGTIVNTEKQKTKPKANKLSKRARPPHPLLHLYSHRPCPQGTAVRFASPPGAVRPRTPPYFSSGRLVALGGFTLRATTMRTSQRARRARGPEQAARFGFGVVGEPSRVTYAQARRPS